MLYLLMKKTNRKEKKMSNNSENYQNIAEISELYQVSLFRCKECHFLLINKKECYCQSVNNNK